MLVCLDDVMEIQCEAPKVSSIVIDGAAVVQMLKLGSAETFDQYAHQVFLQLRITRTVYNNSFDIYNMQFYSI